MNQWKISSVCQYLRPADVESEKPQSSFSHFIKATTPYHVEQSPWRIDLRVRLHFSARDLPTPHNFSSKRNQVPNTQSSRSTFIFLTPFALFQLLSIYFQLYYEVLGQWEGKSINFDGQTSSQVLTYSSSDSSSCWTFGVLKICRWHLLSRIDALAVSLYVRSDFSESLKFKIVVWKSWRHTVSFEMKSLHPTHH